MLEKLKPKCTTIKVLNQPVDDITYEDVLRDTELAIEQNKQVSIASMNVQITYLGSKPEHKDVQEFFNKSTHRIADGYGVIKAAKWFGHYELPKLAGVDLIDKVFDLANKKGYSVFIYGTKEEVLNDAEARLKKEFPNVKIAGHLNGFTNKSFDEIKDIINEAHPNIVVVATGFPLQEEFLSKELDNLDVNFIGAFGGTIDMFTGEQHRAPKWYRDHKLEWLYRIVNLKRPERFFQIPAFLWKAWLSEIKTKNIKKVVESRK